MNMIGVSSSNVAEVGYEASTHTLRVRFTNGNVYDYAQVPEVEYVNLLAAESKGKYLATHIIRGGYVHRKVS